MSRAEYVANANLLRSAPAMRSALEEVEHRADIGLDRSENVTEEDLRLALYNIGRIARSALAESGGAT